MKLTAAPTFTPVRRTMLLTIALLMLPFLLAFGLYWFEWQPATLANHGELIEPPLALPDNGLSLADGRPLPTAELRRKWTLVMVSKRPCDNACQQDLHQMRQVQVALNKEMLRLRRVLIGSSVSALAADPALPELRRNYPDLLIAAPNADPQGAVWRSAVDGTSHRFYVIDPLGNVMMRYTDKPDMAGMLKDLERLLKYSWVG
jgi:cytochrome oxidase Cu insertion factor (SCO1/SenC/PrrC family)